MTPEQEELINKLLKKYECYDEHHEEEHEFLRHLIKERQYRAEFWRKLITRVATGSILAVLAAIVSAVAFSVKHFFLP